MGRIPQPFEGFSEGPSPTQIGPTGKRTDTDEAEALLESAKELGARTLHDLGARAVERLLRVNPGSLDATVRTTTRLFTPEELKALRDVYAAINGTAELLGRARVRLREEEHAKRANFHEDHLTPFEIFMETPSPQRLSPLAPREAIDYFSKLVPTLHSDPERFGLLMERQAFTLAVATDQELLDRIQGIILGRLETGERIRDSYKEIDAILAEAGIAPTNKAYSETVVRTNMMDAYNTGFVREMNQPGVSRTFPVWRMANPDDSRTGEDHAPWIGKYFAADVPFAAVRNWFVVRDGKVVHDPTGRGRPYCCRCVPVPIYRRRWEELQRMGEQAEQWPPLG